MILGSLISGASYRYEYYFSSYEFSEVLDSEPSRKQGFTNKKEKVNLFQFKLSFILLLVADLERHKVESCHLSS